MKDESLGSRKSSHSPTRVCRPPDQVVVRSEAVCDLVFGAWLMINNFEEVKQQLAELADAINKFKSEAVQLKIVDLILKGAKTAIDDADDHPPIRQKRPRKDRRSAAVPSSATAVDGKKRAAVKAKGTGPMATLEQFIQEGFFGQKRTLGVVVDHCKTKARNFKNNELSGPLGRLVRNNKLTRTKNADGQWEYIKK